MVLKALYSFPFGSTKMCDGFSEAALVASASEATAGAAEGASLVAATGAATAGVSEIMPVVDTFAAPSAGIFGTIGSALSSMSGWQMAQLGLSAASGLAQYSAQNQAYGANRSAAINAYNAQLNALSLEQGQIDRQSSQEMSDRAKQAQAAMARLRVAAGESGISGVSVDAASNEISLNEGQDMATLENNRRARANQLNMQAQGMYAQTQSQINAVRPGSLIGMGLQIGAGSLSSFTKSPNNSGVSFNKE